MLIATANRPESLRSCLSLIEAQTLLPTRVIIVDASDDHDAVMAAALADRSAEIRWVPLRAPVKSLAHQRNFGLDHVKSEVVLMPDDDSMLFPDAAAHIMDAYTRDTEGVVGGVAAAVAGHHPQQAALGKSIGRRGGIKQRLQRLRYVVEAKFAPSPFTEYGQSAIDARTLPGWIDGGRFRALTVMGGYQMSFRTSAIQRLRFDEVLGHSSGYCLHEDHEVAMRIHNAGLVLVAAQEAMVFHEQHGGRRAGGFTYGFTWIANMVYTCTKNMPADSRAARHDLPRQARYKLALYAARSLAKRDRYSYDVYRGARRAWVNRAQLAPGPGLERSYRDLCDREITASR